MWTTALLVFFLHADDLHAEQLQAEDDLPLRTLDGHTFLLPQLVESAIVDTHLNQRTSGGGLLVPALPTLVGTFGLSSLNISQEFDVAARLCEIVALQVRVGGAIEAGTTLRSIAFSGFTAQGLGDLGVLVRLFRFISTGSTLSLRPFVDGAVQTQGSLSSLVQQRIATTITQIVSGNLSALLLQPSQSLSYGGALAYAQVLLPQLSVQMATRVYGTTTKASFLDPTTLALRSTTASNANLDTSIAVTVDFAPNRVPIGLLGEYLFGAHFGRAGFNENRFAAGIFYTGRPHLQVGVEAETTLGMTAVNIGSGNSGQPRSFQTQIFLGYFW